MRKYHRIIGFFAGLFIITSALSGLIIQITKDETEEKERAAPINLSSKSLEKILSLEAFNAIKNETDKNQSIVREIHLIPKLNGEDLELIIQHQEFLKKITYHNFNFNNPIVTSFENESFLKRLHSGEVLGDFGVGLTSVVAILLVLLTISGYWILWPFLHTSSGGKKHLSLMKLFK